MSAATRSRGVSSYALLATVTALAASAAAEDRVEVGSIRPLLLAAIANGEAHGALNNDHVGEVLKLFRTSEPPLVDVRKVRDLPEAGCKRLEVATTLRKAYPDARGMALMTTEEKVRTRNGTVPQDVTFAYQISFCSNGKFPKSSKKPEDDE